MPFQLTRDCQHFQKLGLLYDRQPPLGIQEHVLHEIESTLLFDFLSSSSVLVGNHFQLQKFCSFLGLTIGLPHPQRDRLNEMETAPRGGFPNERRDLLISRRDLPVPRRDLPEAFSV